MFKWLFSKFRKPKSKTIVWKESLGLWNINDVKDNNKIIGIMYQGYPLDIVGYYKNSFIVLNDEGERRSVPYHEVEKYIIEE